MLRFEKTGWTFYDVFYPGTNQPMGYIRKSFVDGKFIGFKFYLTSHTYGMTLETLTEISEKISFLNQEAEKEYNAKLCKA